MLTVLRSLLLILLLVMTGCVSPQRPETSPERTTSEATDEFFDLAHGRVHFRVTRGKLPAIVLESGAGADLSQWDSLQPKISQATGLTVISYDRPGFGKSDLPSSAYDPVIEMQQLQEGLKRLGLHKQIVLVGHSYGALLNQYYASRWPQEVRGAILIEPATVGIVDSFGGARAVMKLSVAEVRYDGPEPAPKNILAQRRFFSGFPDTIETFRSAPWPDVPMVVITAGNQWWPTGEQNRLWRAGHESLVAGNPNRSLVVAEGSGHNVPIDRPDIVLSAISNVVARIH